jgi:quercetin dioxygenase-like cupin family protein
MCIVKLVRIQDAQRPEDQGVFARPLLDGAQCSVRIIRLAQGQSLPPHRHGASDLMLFVISGAGELETPEGPVTYEAGALACYSGDEELRVRNTGTAELTLIAFLAPKLG